MNEHNHVLLASHGTDGAIAAELAAMQACKKGDHIHHLLVVPEFWAGMTGDDWLQNGSTRNTFRRYLEGELSREVDEHIARVSKLANEHELNYTSQVVVGEPTKTLLATVAQTKFDVLVMGSKRPKRVAGLRSRMLADDVQKQANIPVMIVAYPEQAHDLHG